MMELRMSRLDACGFMMQGTVFGNAERFTNDLQIDLAWRLAEAGYNISPALQAIRRVHFGHPLRQAANIIGRSGGEALPPARVGWDTSGEGIRATQWREREQGWW